MAEATLSYEPRTVRLPGEGVELTADRFGTEDAASVLLLHGGGQTRHAWRRTAESLAARGWHAVALDLRGHGDSDWPDGGDYDPQHFAADLHAVVRSFEAPPAVVGASLGGMMALTAQRLAAEQLFSAVVLVDITPQMERAGVERIVSFMLAHPEGFSRLEDAADAIAAYRPNKPRPSDLTGLKRTLRLGDDGRWHWRWDVRFLTSKFQLADEGVEALDEKRALMQEHLVAGARSLTVPTLLVRGAQSDVVSKDGVESFLDSVPHAEFVDVEDAGHMVSGDQNDVFTQAVVEFLSRTHPYRS